MIKEPKAPCPECGKKNCLFPGSNECITTQQLRAYYHSDVFINKLLFWSVWWGAVIAVGVNGSIHLGSGQFIIIMCIIAIVAQSRFAKW